MKIKKILSGTVLTAVLAVVLEASGEVSKYAEVQVDRWVDSVSRGPIAKSYAPRLVRFNTEVEPCLHLDKITPGKAEMKSFRLCTFISDGETIPIAGQSVDYWNLRWAGEVASFVIEHLSAKPHAETLLYRCALNTNSESPEIACSKMEMSIDEWEKTSPTNF